MGMGNELFIIEYRESGTTCVTIQNREDIETMKEKKEYIIKKITPIEEIYPGMIIKEYQE